MKRKHRSNFVANRLLTGMCIGTCLAMGAGAGLATAAGSSETVTRSYLDRHNNEQEERYEVSSLQARQLAAAADCWKHLSIPGCSPIVDKCVCDSGLGGFTWLPNDTTGVYDIPEWYF